MSFVESLAIVASAAAAAERITELVKPIYLKIKNRIMKSDFKECTKAEKIILTVFLGTLICLMLQIGIDIPAVDEPAIVQQLFAGLISSVGSNFLHLILTILTGIKDIQESRLYRNKT